MLRFKMMNKTIFITRMNSDETNKKILEIIVSEKKGIIKKQNQDEVAKKVKELIK